MAVAGLGEIEDRCSCENISWVV